MTSIKTKDVAKCPQCHRESPLDTWTTIDGQQDPALRDKIFDGSLFAWQCEYCKKKIGVLHNLLYVDHVNRFVVVLDRKNKEKWVAIENWPDIEKGEYDHLRITNSFLGLCEKIICFENGLDDRALELFKLLLISQMEEDEVDYFVCEGEDDSGLLMRAWKDGKQLGLFAAPPDLYQQMEEQMENDPIKNSADSLERIDQQWAMEFMRAKFGQAKSS